MMEKEKKTKDIHEYLKNWRLNNPDKIKASRNKWYTKNKDNDEFKQRKKEYNKNYYKLKKENSIKLEQEMAKDALQYS